MTVINQVYGYNRNACMDKVVEYIDKPIEEHIFYSLYSNIVFELWRNTFVDYEGFY
jgi:hypothetical protein